MKKTFIVFCLINFSIFLANAQKKYPDDNPKPPAPLNRMVVTDTAVVTKSEVTIKGQRIPYTATAGMMPVWDEAGKAIAGVFYTYYERSDIRDRATRPLIISFNGGPGTPSVWMEIGYTGPRILNVDDEGYPVQPYGVRENPNSILDVADIV
ncbi:MAG TPA: hypothetical protein VKR53_01750, partial [Puia sp.]|nr:hypothetical protein [Puia sp.]